MCVRKLNLFVFSGFGFLSSILINTEEEPLKFVLSYSEKTDSLSRRGSLAWGAGTQTR